MAKGFTACTLPSTQAQSPDSLGNRVGNGWFRHDKTRATLEDCAGFWSDPTASVRYVVGGGPGWLQRFMFWSGGMGLPLGG
jgi:hypothetical protein